MSVITVSNQAVVDEAVRQFKERCESVSSQREMALLEQELWQQVRAHISASGSSAGRKQRWWDVALGGRNLAMVLLNAQGMSGSRFGDAVRLRRVLDSRMAAN